MGLAMNRSRSFVLAKCHSAPSQVVLIAGSPTNLQPVLDTVAENAARVCAAFDAVLVLVEVTDRTHGRTYPRQRFYSVPFALAGKTLWLRATDTAVAIHEDFRHVVTHLKALKPGMRRTLLPGSRVAVVDAPDPTMHAHINYLRQHGYAHYEISSFARPGREAVHAVERGQVVGENPFGPCDQGGVARPAPAAHIAGGARARHACVAVPGAAGVGRAKIAKARIEARSHNGGRA